MEALAQRGLSDISDPACLNCESLVTGQFCGHCWQKASKHRYSIKHFILHDFVHEIWHVDKGVVRTISDLLTRPGIGVREFLMEKGSAILMLKPLSL